MKWRAINGERLNLVSQLISQADEFVNQVYIPDLLAVASFYKDWAKYGGGLKNYLAYGEFPTKGYDRSRLVQVRPRCHPGPRSEPRVPGKSAR